VVDKLFSEYKIMNTQTFGNSIAEVLEAVRVDDVTPVELGNGCYRRDLPSTAGVRVWVVDISPGGEWPHIDQHDAAGENLYVVSGELIEGDLRFQAGTYVFFKPGSSHRPRSEKGVRLFGFNLAEGPSINGREAMSLYGSKQLLESIRTVRQNTILIAEDIPEKDYGYRPAPESRSVAETLVHIALLPRADRLLHDERHVSSLEGFDFGRLIKTSEIEEKRPRSKQEIIELLHGEGERWCQWLEALPESLLAEPVRMPGGASKNRFEMLLGTKEHEMHHRAQLMVVERMLGIVPHLTRQRQPVPSR
jgi:uncharacterized damage-inducible protein DinB